MKFLADENIEQPIVTALRKQGHNVLYAIDLPPGTADDDILTPAHRESRILITNDKCSVSHKMGLIGVSKSL